jgi:rRNA maturation endonuclease Nob1
VFVALCVLLAIATIGFALGIRDKDIPPLPTENPELKHLQERRATLFENLKDLQFEYLQGKLSDEDYQSLKLGFQNDLAVVMASIDLHLKNPAPGTSPSARPENSGEKIHSAEKKTSMHCPSCGTEIPTGNRFCGSCGAQL